MMYWIESRINAEKICVMIDSEISMDYGSATLITSEKGKFSAIGCKAIVMIDGQYNALCYYPKRIWVRWSRSYSYKRNCP